MTSTRALLKWMAILLLLAQVGCATRGARGPSPDLPVTLSGGAEKGCEEIARARAADVPETSVAGGLGKGFLEGFAAGFYVLGVGEIFMAPLGAIWGGVEAAMANSKARRQAHDAVLNECLGEKAAAGVAQDPHAAAERDTREESYGVARSGDAHAIGTE